MNFAPQELRITRRTRPVTRTLVDLSIAMAGTAIRLAP
jgi:hypothetical protein